MRKAIAACESQGGSHSRDWHRAWQERQTDGSAKPSGVRKWAIWAASAALNRPLFAWALRYNLQWYHTPFLVACRCTEGTVPNFCSHYLFFAVQQVDPACHAEVLRRQDCSQGFLHTVHRGQLLRWHSPCCFCTILFVRSLVCHCSCSADEGQRCQEAKVKGSLYFGVPTSYFSACFSHLLGS